MKKLKQNQKIICNNKRFSEKNMRGITLIALVVTIIVLIILATVSINAVVGENGLIKKTQDTANLQKMAEEKERLELIKPEVAIENDGKISVDNYIKKLIEKGITEEDYVEINEDESKQVITDTGYSVNIKQDGEYNVIITIDGKADALPVRIEKVKLTTSTNSIKVDVEVKRGEGAQYKYYYKTENTGYGETVYEGDKTSHTITNLEQNITYTIKVEAINKNGTVYKEAVGRTTEVPTAEGVVEFGELNWNNGQAEVTISKNTDDELKIKYKVLDKDLNVIKDYQEIASGEKITGLNLGEIVKASLWDGTNYGASASLTVIDTTAPSTPIITAKTSDNNNYTSGTWTNKNVTITASSSDSESRIKQIEYSYDNQTWKTDWGTNIINNSNTSTISGTWSSSNNTNVYVRAIDNAENASDTSSIKLQLDKTAPSISNFTVNTTGYATSKTLTVTATDNGGSGIKGYYIGTSSTQPATSNFGTSNTKTVTANGTYYAWVLDNVGNVSSRQTLTVSNIDTTAPSISSFTVNTTGYASSKTLTVTATDNGGSGIKGYYIGTSSTQPATSSFGTSNTKTVIANGTYYAWVIDNVGNVSSRQTLVVDKIGYPTYSVGDVVTVYSDLICRKEEFYVIKDSGDMVTLLYKTLNGNAVWDSAKTSASRWGSYFGGTGRLLTKSEAQLLPDSIRLCDNGYWLADAYMHTAWFVSGVGTIRYNTDFNATTALGVRPVVEISKSKLD